MLALDEVARLLGIDPQTVKIWARHGLVAAHRYNDKQECLYEHPGEPLPVKMQGADSPIEADRVSSSYRIALRRCSVEHSPWHSAPG
jgi:hypothetical protein